MAQITITELTYLCAGTLFFLLACIYSYQARKKLIHWSLSIGCLSSAIWLVSSGLNVQLLNFTATTPLIIELLRYIAWIFALTATLRFLLHEKIPTALNRLAYGAMFFAFIVIGFHLSYKIPEEEMLVNLSCASLILSIAGLISVEQLYKNIDQNRQIKLLCLNLGVLFIFDIYFFTNCLIFGAIDPDLWQIRAVISVGSAALITIGTVVLDPRSAESASLSFSRPIVFYSTSLMTAGTLIIVLAIGGYYVKELKGDWITVIYSLFLFIALMAIMVVFLSSMARESLSVLINKHFFSHKYDYRIEWLNLIYRLSLPTMPEQTNMRAYQAIVDIVKAKGGAMWLRDGNQYVMSYQQDIQFETPPPNEPIDSDFCTILRKQQWIFVPGSIDDSTRSKYNEYLPLWLRKIPKVWIVLPLLTEHDLFGYVILTRPKVDASLTWEDIDLLKTVGRQVSSYLERHSQAEQLMESSQFDTFHRLSAFIMHDLKNLIAQQALVVQNASKHKDNPEFFEDAIQTISNSVDRMNGLLRKLQHSDHAEIRPLKLQEVLIEASGKCQDKKPLPTLRLDKGAGTINGDNDRLVMAITHLITNAQDATKSSGFIDICVQTTQNNAMITIADNGEGMDEDFINSRLFKPFDSTKEGKGMGIGVYQAKEIITQLKGTLSVESTPGEGSTFTINLPLTKTATK